MSTAQKPIVYITRRIPISGLKYLQQFCDTKIWDSDEPVDEATFKEQINGAAGLFCLLSDKVTRSVIESAGSSLKVISTMSVGFDHIDLAACKERGIQIGYTPGILTDATATLAVSLLLASSRRISEGIDAVRNGEWGTWSPLWLCGPTLMNATVGIVGLGNIGLAVAKRLQGFGVSRFLYSGNTPKEHAKELSVDTSFVHFDDLLAQSDFVVVTCSLNDKTKGLFNSVAFTKMKNSAVFVNISRGSVVVQDDLIDALRNGAILSAGLDVTTPEPLPTDSPLLSLKNCVVIPHIGSAENQTRNDMSELTARNIVAALTRQEMPSELKF